MHLNVVQSASSRQSEEEIPAVFPRETSHWGLLPAVNSPGVNRRKEQKNLTVGEAALATQCAGG